MLSASFVPATSRESESSIPADGLYHLTERPEGDRVTVRKASSLSPSHQLVSFVDPLGELLDQPRLPHPRARPRSSPAHPP